MHARWRCAPGVEGRHGVLGKPDGGDGEGGGPGDHHARPDVQEGHEVAERLAQVLVRTTRPADHQAQLYVGQRPCESLKLLVEW